MNRFSYLFAELFSYQIVQVLQVALVVQGLQVCLFLGHLVSQLVQGVPGVPHHLLKKTQKADV